MTLANRVDPWGALHATAARGAMFGNRGGRFHDPATRLASGRPWASRQWICCVLSFKGRKRDVWGRFYTELFFADEVTALAAGHRPCFECRRAAATDFAECWRTAQGLERRPSAPEMDVALHAERLEGRAKRLHAIEIADAPDGAMVVLGGRAHAVRGDALLPWKFEVYGPPVPKPGSGTLPLLTPPSIVAVLRKGYRPFWRGETG